VDTGDDDLGTKKCGCATQAGSLGLGWVACLLSLVTRRRRT
jgi:hypothetical protein